MGGTHLRITAVFTTSGSPCLASTHNLCPTLANITCSPLSLIYGPQGWCQNDSGGIPVSQCNCCGCNNTPGTTNFITYTITE